MPDLPAFLLAAALLTLAPGPDNLQVLMRGMVQGRRAGLAAAIGFAAGVTVHTALAASGVSLLIRATPTLFGLLQAAGAAYLLYLGYRTLRHPGFLMPNSSSDDVGLGTVFRQCFIGNVLNPKVGLFFLSFLPQFVDVRAGGEGRQMLVLGLLFMAQTVLIFGTIGWCAADLGRWLRRHERHGRRLNTLAGLTFVGIGIKLALAGATG
ncbi:LysE family translocator [Denitratisoma sp. agr-D3]